MDVMYAGAAAVFVRFLAGDEGVHDHVAAGAGAAAAGVEVPRHDDHAWRGLEVGLAGAQFLLFELFEGRDSETGLAVEVVADLTFTRSLRSNPWIS